MKKLLLTAALTLCMVGVTQARTSYAVVSEAEILLPNNPAVETKINDDLDALRRMQGAKALEVMDWYAADPENWHSFTTKYEVMNSGPAYFSLRSDCSYYPQEEGVFGHDGTEIWTGHNYRLTDGKKITLTDYYGDPDRATTFARFADGMYDRLEYELGGNEMAVSYFADSAAGLEYIIGMYDVPQLIFAPGLVTPRGYGSFEYRLDAREGVAVTGPRGAITRLSVLLPKHPNAAARINAELRAAIDNYENRAREVMCQAGNDNRRGDYYFAEVETKLTNFPDNYLSILIEYDEFTGGAHGYSATEGLVFDTTSGARLSLSDYYGDPDKATTVARIGDTLRAAVAEHTGGDTFGLEDFLADPNREFNYYYSSIEGVVVVFSPESIGPWAIGEIRVTLPYYG